MPYCSPGLSLPQSISSTNPPIVLLFCTIHPHHELGSIIDWPVWIVIALRLSRRRLINSFSLPLQKPHSPRVLRSPRPFAVFCPSFIPQTPRTEFVLTLFLLGTLVPHLHEKGVHTASSAYTIPQSDVAWTRSYPPIPVLFFFLRPTRATMASLSASKRIRLYLLPSQRCSKKGAHIRTLGGDPFPRGPARQHEDHSST